MYALKYCGMFIRVKDGLMTDNKASAILFGDPVAAEKYAENWKVTTDVHQVPQHSVQLIEVETRPTISRVGKVVREF